MFLLDLCCGLKNTFEIIVSLKNCDNQQNVFNRHMTTNEVKKDKTSQQERRKEATDLPTDPTSPSDLYRSNLSVLSVLWLSVSWESHGY